MLIPTILCHFVGHTNALKEWTQELVMNLRCPSLTHFRWYKDTFLSLLFQRDDSTLDFLKERFLTGLELVSEISIMKLFHTVHLLLEN